MEYDVFATVVIIKSESNGKIEDVKLTPKKLND